MAKRSARVTSLLEVFRDLEANTSNSLNKIVIEKEKREYRDDILQLASIDVVLLTSYYMNSNVEAQKQFLNLLNEIYSDKMAVERFMAEFSNLYSLNKLGLSNIAQFGAAKRVVLDFINKLKDKALAEKKLDKRKEKELGNKLFILKKLIRYFSATPGTVEVRNVDDFITMLDMLDISDKVRNKALCIAIENNSKYYRKNIKLAMENNALDLD